VPRLGFREDAHYDALVSVTVGEFRQNIYELLDRVLDTGLPLEIVRNGRRLRVVPGEAQRKLDLIVKHDDYIVGDPEKLVHINWSTWS